MRRAKLGDVFCIKVPNGYKIFQWAYRVERKGDYMRVFPGLYDSVPENIEQIVLSEHSYIIAFHISRAYRIGLAQWLGNFPVPEQYPFPKIQIAFKQDNATRDISAIDVMSADGTRNVMEIYYVKRMEQLPKAFRNEKLLNAYLTPNWLLYLFDNNFDMQHPDRFFIFGPNPEAQVQKYTDIIDSYINKQRGDL